jgi:hypothetical protein
VSISVTWRHSVSLGVTRCHLASLGFTWCHSVSLGVTRCHLASLGFTLTSLGFTWCHSVSLGVTRFHFGVTRFHLVSLGFTGCHSVSPKTGSRGFSLSFPHDSGLLRSSLLVGRSIFSPLWRKKDHLVLLGYIFLPKNRFSRKLQRKQNDTIASFPAVVDFALTPIYEIASF